MRGVAHSLSIVRKWPVPAISEAEFCTYRLVALWAVPEQRQYGMLMTGFAPKPTVLELSYQIYASLNHVPAPLF